MRAMGLRVPRAQAETVRQRLLLEGSLRSDLKPSRSEALVVFPVADDVPGAEPFEFDELPERPRSYQEVARVPTELRAKLPSAFDVIGHVIVVKLPEELAPHANEVARALLATHANARTVALDRGVAGEYRVRRLEVIAGDPLTETEYVENGVRLLVDPAKAYFSPRLGYERARVASLVVPGETVVDLFAGVGPWAVLLAKRAKPARVWAVDLNPDAVRLLRRNVESNRVGNVVVPVEADARAFAQEHAGIADRVVANLPHDAHRFFEDAAGLLKPGGILHHHAILAEEGVPPHVADLSRRAEAMGRRLSLAGERVVRAYSPTDRHVALDLAIG